MCTSTARSMAWARTETAWRVHLYDEHGALQYLLSVRPPAHGPPAIDGRRRRHVVELTAHTRELDDLAAGIGLDDVGVGRSGRRGCDHPAQPRRTGTGGCPRPPSPRAPRGHHRRRTPPTPRSRARPLDPSPRPHLPRHRLRPPSHRRRPRPHPRLAPRRPEHRRRPRRPVPERPPVQTRPPIRLDRRTTPPRHLRLDRPHRTTPHQDPRALRPPTPTPYPPADGAPPPCPPSSPRPHPAHRTRSPPAATATATSPTPPARPPTTSPDDTAPSRDNHPAATTTTPTSEGGAGRTSISRSPAPPAVARGDGDRPGARPGADRAPRPGCGPARTCPCAPWSAAGRAAPPW